MKIRCNFVSTYKGTELFKLQKTSSHDNFTNESHGIYEKG